MPSIDQTWWTEAHATWTGAVALILIFVLDSVLACFHLRENQEARHERRLAEIDRQRSEVTLGELTSMLRSLNEEQLCTVLWASNFRHAGFAFEKDFYAQLPEYLRRKCDPILEEIKKPTTPEAHQKARFLLVFRFPYLSKLALRAFCLLPKTPDDELRRRALQVGRTWKCKPHGSRWKICRREGHRPSSVSAVKAMATNYA